MLNQLKNQNQKNNRIKKKRIRNEEVFDFQKLIITTEIVAELLLKKGDRILKRKLCGKVKWLTLSIPNVTLLKSKLEKT